MAKKEAVREMFNDLAPKYDAMNHWFSLNIDKSWRRKALREIPVGAYVLDEACGTADFSLLNTRYFSPAANSVAAKVCAFISQQFT